MEPSPPIYSSASAGGVPAPRRPAALTTWSAVAVLLFVIRAELARLERAPPRFVLAIPRDGHAERVTEPVTRRPAQLPNLVRVDRVAPIMAQTILHRLDQRLGLAGKLEDLPREDDVLDFVAAPDVVDLALAPLAQHQVDARTVVEDVEPVAHVAAVAVERQRPVVEGVGHEERNDLLGILIGPEVVRRASDQ